MLKQKYQKNFCFSVLIHLCLLSILVISFEFSSKVPVTQLSDKKEMLLATVMELPNPTKVIQKPAAMPAPQPLKPPEVSPKATPAKPPAIKTQAIAIPDKTQKLKEEAIQKQLLADLKKQQEEKKKQKQKELQAALEKEMKELKAHALQQQMLQEQKRLANIRSQEMQGVVDKYKALILQSISQNWRIPPNANKKRFAELMIRLAPGGMVLDVQLIKSSGDEGVDRSARSAVFKSSPLPVPSEADLFASFRNFVLKVKPENVLTE